MSYAYIHKIYGRTESFSSHKYEAPLWEAKAIPAELLSAFSLITLSDSGIILR